MAGGMITVIGTSTNLILQGLIVAEGEVPPGFQDYLFPGLLVAAAAILYLSTAGYALLPERDLINTRKKAREYIVEVDLARDSKLIEKTVEEAGLATIEGLELFEIIRQDFRISPVQDYQRIREKDSLVFVGSSDKIVALLERADEFAIPHLEGDDSREKLRYLRQQEDEEKKDSPRPVVETVIPINSALIGRSLKGSSFRSRYDAAVIGIHRNGQDISRKLDRIRLRAGDLLLLVPGENFRKDSNQADDLYVVSIVKKTISGARSSRAGFLIVAAGVIAALAFGIVSLFTGLLILASSLVVFKMTGIADLKKEFSVSLFIILVASLAFSTALINSGVAEMAAAGFLRLFEASGAFGILAGIYLITLLLGTFITHAATVAIIFPIAYTVGSRIPDLPLTALFLAIAFAASASFHTPFSYQTNLMVYGPGGYKLTDFLKTGLPLTLLYSLLVLGFLSAYYL